MIPIRDDGGLWEAGFCNSFKVRIHVSNEELYVRTIGKGAAQSWEEVTVVAVEKVEMTAPEFTLACESGDFTTGGEIADVRVFFVASGSYVPFCAAG